MDAEFVGDHFDPKGAKAAFVNYQKRPYGSMNIAERGHPHPTAALDRSTLCSFGGPAAAGVCAPQPAGRTAMQRAMLQKVEDSRRRTFRCVEEGTSSAMKRNQLRASARCLQMLGTDGTGTAR